MIDTSQDRPPQTRSEKGTRQMIERQVVLRGLTPMMFDRYPGDNDTQLHPWEKFYFGDDGKSLMFPSRNVMSFLSSQNTDSAPKRTMDARKYKRTALAAGSFVVISPWLIPLTRDGEPIVLGKPDGDHDELSGCFLDRSVARLEKGIPNPKVRPVVPTPWELEFTLRLYPNPDLQEQMLKNLFELGGIALGLGTWRGQYGKFEVLNWS